MKKLLLAATIATLSVSAAQAAPTVYGKLHVGVTSTDQFTPKTNSKGTYKKGDVDNVAQVDSYASRIGVKGSEVLTDNLNAIYGIEWELSTDGTDAAKDSTGSSISGSDLTQRNRFVGLSYNGIGALKIGKLDSHLKTSQGKVDIFNDMTADMKSIMAGENRLNNVVSLESDPKALAGIGFNVMAQQAENSAPAGVNSDDEDRRFGSAVSGSITYDNQDIGLYAAVAADQNVVSTFAANGKKAETQAFRVTGALNAGALVTALDGLNLGVLVQTAEPKHLSAAAKAAAVTGATPAPAGDFHNFDREDSFLVSGGYTIPETPITLKAQYGQSKTQYDGSGQDVKLEVFGAMAEYKFNSKTRTYAFWSQLADDRTDKKTGLDTADRNIGGVGLEYNF